MQWQYYYSSSRAAPQTTCARLAFATVPINVLLIGTFCCEPVLNSAARINFSNFYNVRTTYRPPLQMGTYYIARILDLRYRYIRIPRQPRLPGIIRANAAVFSTAYRYNIRTPPEGIIRDNINPICRISSGWETTRRDVLNCLQLSARLSPHPSPTAISMRVMCPRQSVE